MKEFNFHSASSKDVESFLQTDTSTGLQTEEADARLERYGVNTIAEEKVESSWRIFIRQLNNPLVFLLLFATIISIVFKEWIDATAILMVILINAAIGFYMELKARSSMKALKSLSSVPAKVLRNGNIVEINSEQVVPGDVVFAEAGDMVVADGRIFRLSQLLIDESALTGESVPVEKTTDKVPENAVLADRTNMAYKGTYVSKGNFFLLVSSTGMNTELGKIAGLVQSSKQAATPLEKKLQEFTRKLIWITLLLVLIIFVVGLINGQKIADMLYTCIALSVAAIPEGLSIVATMTLARGMLKMAKHNVIVKKLSSVETLGGTNIICTDKTGTLTQNKMEVVSLFSPTSRWEGKDRLIIKQHPSFELVTKCAILCNTAQIESAGGETKEMGDPLEVALLKFAEKTGEDIAEVRAAFPKVDEEPFSSETKIMATMHEHNGQFVIFAKGAAEELIERCHFILLKEGAPELSHDTKNKWLKQAEKQASEGKRVIALAYKEVQKKPLALSEELVFLGLIGMMDPIRPEVFAAIKDCQSAGIKIMMITGDHPSTAKQIGKQLKIVKHEGVLTGRQMKDYDDLNEHEKQKWIESAVFARVTPKNKLDLVQVLQEKNYVVGMTGDGINDAPALKKADIGIAMGQRGTQVAQEVADMILKDDSFSSIVVAIKQGRVIFENIRKFVTFLLSCNLSELFIIALVAIMNFHFQLLPLQILFINLITDVLPAMALGVTKGSKDIMKRLPRKASEPIINNKRWRSIIFYALVISLVNVVAVLISHYSIYQNDTSDVDMCNNILFFTLILSQLLHVLNMGRGFIFTSDVFRNRYVWFSIIGSLVILFAVIQVPLVRQALNIISMTFTEWLVILSASILSIVIIQLFSFFKKSERSV